jgi:uncharacterized protein
MRDDLLRARLAESNPWWTVAVGGSSPTAWIAFDRLLQARSKTDIGFRSPVLNDIATGPVGDSLVVLQGPRRVGKSVVLRDLAVALCNRADVDTRQIIHISCDGLTSQDLIRVLKLGRDLTRSVDAPEVRTRVWLLDEVTPVKGWATALKHARDSSQFGDDTVIATGSSWRADEDVEGNLFAGRAGTTSLKRLRHIFPMSFREYVQSVRQQLPTPETMHPSLLQSESARSVFESMQFSIDDYDLAWQAFLSTGGFPRAVHAVETTGGHDRAYLEDLHAWLRRDVDPEGPPESIAALLAVLHQRGSSPLDRTSTAVALGYPNRQSFDRRLGRLVNSFAALWCPQRDDRGRPVPNTQPKLYLADPVLAWIPQHLRAGTPPPDYTTLTEQVMGVTLARVIESAEPGRWIAGDTIGYGRTSTGNEVDLAPISLGSAGGPVTSVPIESKWVSDGWRKEAMTIEGRHGSGILATKTVLNLEHAAWAVPAPILAMVIG